jgi:hypothetical protein
MRRGQLTLIVILGLILILLVGLLLLRPGAKSVSITAQQDTARVQQFVQGCLAQTGEDVLRQMGASGGYLTTTGFTRSNSERDTQVVTIPPQEVVLWHEIHPCEQSPSGCLGNNRPPLCKRGERACPIPTAANTNPKAKSIQEQLEAGIAAQIDTCLDFDSAFESQMSVERKGSPAVRAVIREESIGLSLNYPLEVTTTTKETVDLSDYASELDVRLPDLYRFATKIQESETRVAFLENIFLHLHAIYSGADTELPPIREVQLFGGGSKTWLRSQVQQRIERDLLPFMNFIQVINAQDSFAPVLSHENDSAYAEYADGAYRYLVVKLDDSVYPYGARFEYPNTPIFLDINGKEVLQPQKFGGGGFFARLAGVFFTQYKFKYTVAFPVIVHLDDPAAFNDKGYSLDFGIEGNIRNNYPLNVSVDPAVLRNSYTTLDLSDPSQLVNHIYKVKVKDKRTGAPIPKATVQYECGVRYYMGETDGSGTWTGKLPYCFVGGAVVTQASGYLGTGKDLSNSEDDGLITDVPISLWPIREKLVRVYKRTIDDTAALTPPNGSFDNARSKQYRTPVTSNETVILEASRIKDTPYDDDIPLAGMLRFGNESVGASANVPPSTSVAQLKGALDEALANGGLTQAQYNDALAQLNAAAKQFAADNTTIDDTGGEFTAEKLVDLVPGTYDLNGMVMYGRPFTIPATSVKGGTIEARNYTSWVSGGVVLTGANGVYLPPEFIYGDGDLTLYVLEQGYTHTLTYYCPTTGECSRAQGGCAAYYARQDYYGCGTQPPANATLPFTQVTATHTTSHPQIWDDVLSYQPIEDYQSYGRQLIVRPEISQ